MKMVMAIVPRDEADRVLEALVRAGHTATYGESRGGALRQAQKTLFVAVVSEKLEEVLGVIRQSCRVPLDTSLEVRDDFSLGPVPVTTALGGAVVFIWDIDRFETY